MYRYRSPAMPGAARAAEAERYERLYQRTQDGHGVPWTVAVMFPVMALEEGFPRYKIRDTMDALDRWMAHFMVRNYAEWEKRNHAG